MGYLEENMKALKTRPMLYKIIKEKLDNGEYDCSYIEEIDSRDGNKVLCINKDGKKLRLNSLYRPAQEADKWVEQFDFNNISVSVVMFGMGNLIFVRKVLERLKKDCLLFLSEPSLDIFIYNLKNRDISDILSDTRIYLFIGGINDDELFVSMQMKVHWSMLPTQIVCNHPVYDKIYMEQYRDFLVAIRKMNNLENTNRNTEAYMARQTVLNVLRNMHFIKKSNYIIDFNGDIPEDVPAIIVSAGPSLDKNIDELKRAEGKAFILATDTSIKYLLAHNINFDAAVTIDPRKWPKHMEDPRCADVPIFCSLEGRNEILEKNTGRKIWFNGRYFLKRLYGKYHRNFPEQNIGGSVATSAFNVCETLGFKTIVFIGQDLAYSGEKTHAGGIKKKVKYEENGIEYVEGIDGEKIRSRYDWIIYRDWFEENIKLLKNVEVIDATEGGALIKGTKIMKLSDVIDKYCNAEISFRKIVDNKPYTFSDDEYADVRKDIVHLEREFRNIKDRALEGRKAVDSFTKLVKNGVRSQVKEDKYLKVIKKANNFIEKQPADELLDEYIAADVSEKLMNINQLTDDEDQNMLDTLEITGIVYDTLVKSVDELKDEMDKMLASV